MSRDKVTIYGHEVEIDHLKPGDIVSDVVVLCRVLSPRDDGYADYITTSPTGGTGGIVQMGMAAAFVELVRGQQE